MSCTITKVGGGADSSIIIKFFPEGAMGQGYIVQVAAAAASLSGIFVWSFLITFRNRTESHKPVTQHQSHTCAGRFVSYESWKYISIYITQLVCCSIHFRAVSLIQSSVNLLYFLLNAHHKKSFYACMYLYRMCVCTFMWITNTKTGRWAEEQAVNPGAFPHDWSGHGPPCGKEESEYEEPELRSMAIVLEATLRQTSATCWHDPPTWLSVRPLRCV